MVKPFIIRPAGLAQYYEVSGRLLARTKHGVQQRVLPIGSSVLLKAPAAWTAIFPYCMALLHGFKAHAKSSSIDQVCAIATAVFAALLT